MPIALTRTALSTLPAGVSGPGYDPAALNAGIVHVGVGNFHRAHQAVYLDELFAQGLDHDWAIIGAGVRATDAAMRDDLLAQDLLTTVVARDTGVVDTRITAAMTGFVDPADPGALIRQMCDPAIRIVSLTVTEGGYYIDPATQSFDAGHPEILADAANPDHPRTAFGLILEALRLRREAGTPAFTVMSCDNIPGNGHVTRDTALGLARLGRPGMVGWLEAEVAFPDSMVDRITPATSDRERALLLEQTGIIDRRPVFCEDFRQWVLEDHFPTGRPALEQVGVQFVADVAPFELMKIRILNGGHAAIAYPAGLMDIHFVHEAMQNPLIAAWLERLLQEEVIPTVPPVPDTDLQEYKRTILARFGNPQVGDTIRRLCLDGSNRQPKFILPTVAARLETGASVRGLALAGAFWCRYCAGTTDSGAEIAPNDPAWERLNSLARQAQTDPEVWLGMGDIFGPIAGDPAYRQAFAGALKALANHGTEAVLRDYLGPRRLWV